MMDMKKFNDYPQSYHQLLISDMRLFQHKWHEISPSHAEKENTKPQAATNCTNHPDGLATPNWRFVCLVAPKVLCVMFSGCIVWEYSCHSCSN